MILEDANNDTADAALETRFYPLQNWRADVVCVGKLHSGGFQLVEVVDYDTYGNAVSRPPVSADFNQNGGLDTDFGDFYAVYELGEPEADADLDSSITPNDVAVFLAAFEAGILGPSRGSGASSGVIAGYAGYVRDRFASDGALYHVRHRVYDTRMGTWTRRDPLGYVDGMGLYQYCAGVSIAFADPAGLRRDTDGPGANDSWTVHHGVYVPEFPSSPNGFFFDFTQAQRDQWFLNFKLTHGLAVSVQEFKNCLPRGLLLAIAMNEMLDYSATERFRERLGFGRSVGIFQLSRDTVIRDLGWEGIDENAFCTMRDDLQDDSKASMIAAKLLNKYIDGLCKDAVDGTLSSSFSDDILGRDCDIKSFCRNWSSASCPERRSMDVPDCIAGALAAIWNNGPKITRVSNIPVNSPNADNHADFMKELWRQYRNWRNKK